MEVQVSSGLLQGQGLWVQQTWVWHKPSWRWSPLTPPESHQNLHRTGKIDSRRAQTKLCVHQDQEKGAVTIQETAPDLPVGVWVSLAEVWVRWPAAGLGALSVAVHAMDLLREVTSTFIASITVWPQVNTGREQSSTHQQKIGLTIY